MSAIAESHPSIKGINLRAFLAGGGATSALIAGAAVVFLSAAAFVAFNGLPFGGGGSDDGTVLVGAGPGGVPEAAGAALAGAPGAVAAAPAAPFAVAPAAGAGTGPDAPPVIPGDGSLPELGGPGDSRGPGGIVPPTPGGGAVQGTVAGIENTAGNLGVDIPLSNIAGGVAGAVDRGLNETLNTIGGRAGNPHLGDQVSEGGRRATGALLGDGGAGERIIGRP